MMNINRRTLLQIGGASWLASALPGAATAANSALPVRAKSVIFLHQWGGPSHHESFDMKPGAPAEIRGQFKPISTRVAGVQVSEHLPRMAGVMDRVTLIRSMNHRMQNHNSAGYYSLTGHAPPTDDQRLRDTPELFPAYGSTVDALAPAPPSIPTFVGFPYTIRDGSVTPGQQSGFLSRRHAPLVVLQDPNQPNFRLPELTLPATLTPERMANRRAMQALVDKQTALWESSTPAQGLDAAYERALAMLASPKVRQAFDLSQEPAALRDRYGRHAYGQSCLLARRLVEAGTRFVNVYFSTQIGGPGQGWDTHETIFPQLEKRLLPLTNDALPTLIDDLDSRGLLEQTLVVWMGEFGRTPKINGKAGRDHWPRCYTALLAGGGTKRGYVHGASDKLGGTPARDPVRPDDLCATMYYLLGIDPTTEFHDALDRPLPISAGTPVKGIIS